jgi:TolA-binding protein
MKQTLWIAVIVLIAGCSSDAKVARIAEKAADRQAEQNKEMVRLQHEVAAASKDLVAADAQARKEMAEVHHNLTEQQHNIHQQHNQLEHERQDIARQRQRDPIIAAAIQDGGLIIACLLPLLLAALVIWRLRDSGEELQTLNQVLIQELVAEEPRLLPRPESSERRRRLAGSRAASEDPPF